MGFEMYLAEALDIAREQNLLPRDIAAILATRHPSARLPNYQTIKQHMINAGLYTVKPLKTVETPLGRLTIRTATALANLDIKDLLSLSRMTASELMKLPNFAEKSLKEVRQLLAANNMTLLGESAAAAKSGDAIEMQRQLGILLNFAGKVAVAIRMNSAYNGSSRDNPHVPYDVMWLSDALHNFTMLGCPLTRDDPARVMGACEMLISIYENYQNPAPVHGVKSHPKETFDRHAEFFSLGDAIDALRAIHGIVSGQAPADQTHN